MALLTGNARYPQVDVSIFEYHTWAQLLFAGHLPWQGFSVEYPPGVFPAMLLPGSLFVYELEFIIVALIADAVVTRMLERRGKWLGAWFWCMMPIAVGPIIWVRFEVLLAALLVGFVVSVSERRWRAAAFCVAGATVLKLWPVLLVAAGWYYLPRTSRRRFVFWAVAGIAAPFLVVICAGGTHGLLRMLEFQSGRGLEVESLGAVPYTIAHSFLVGPWPVPAHGSGEYPIGGWAAVMVTSAMPVALLLFATAWWRRKKRHAPLTLPATLLGVVAVLLVTAKVLSAQYVLWAIAAVVLILDDLPHEQRRRLVLVSVAYAGATQFLFPWAWWHLMFNDTTGVVATVLHGELLVLWVAVALTTAFTSGRPRRQRAGMRRPDLAELTPALSA